MSTALKEWSLVCDLLISGHQIALIRKGGIHEPHRSAFTLEHDSFLLYPNAEHQSAALVHPKFHNQLHNVTPRDDGEVVVPGWCHVTDILPLTDPARAHALTHHTCWTDAFFAQRLAYKPERPLLLLLTRAYRFSTPLRLPYHKLYAGCRSWVPLRDTVNTVTLETALPALGDTAYEAQRQAILSAIA
ncbi:MAG TPA: DUF1802 family protein [Chloroflexota bacterium]|nr:DUF1802 family protein [Chloroflexota bacterium]